MRRASRRITSGLSGERMMRGRGPEVRPMATDRDRAGGGGPSALADVLRLRTDSDWTR
jgi:hypothetical protein